jgi:hypothetical protein
LNSESAASVLSHYFEGLNTSATGKSPSLDGSSLSDGSSPSGSSCTTGSPGSSVPSLSLDDGYDGGKEASIGATAAAASMSRPDRDMLDYFDRLAVCVREVDDNRNTAPKSRWEGLKKSFVEFECFSAWRPLVRVAKALSATLEDDEKQRILPFIYQHFVKFSQEERAAQSDWRYVRGHTFKRLSEFEAAGWCVRPDPVVKSAVALFYNGTPIPAPVRLNPKGAVTLVHDGDAIPEPALAPSGVTSKVSDALDGAGDAMLAPDAAPLFSGR